MPKLQAQEKFGISPIESGHSLNMSISNEKIDMSQKRVDRIDTLCLISARSFPGSHGPMFRRS